ncbi:histidine phosphatase family protein [Herbiconiux sp. CPCC 205763]|uniref:Histidine phosphatase family protein n=1 Tax=Herbiconiux aconitum TaxID=2970913 RepID=A0ABT2GWB9_9MICO|nr:histidine phosphatase family protein [Herbiconiux aconitum]MCS5719224.1 histidine phosphatase family protein [Herbiconiux aconitum]
MRLLLIRHGQTIDNVRGALGTVVPGPGLTDLGREQAAAVPAALADEEIEAVFVSTMLRTEETAAPLARALGLRPVVLEGIQEIDAGTLEGRSDEEAIRSYMGTIFTWWTDFSARIPGGENGTEFYERYDGAISALSEQYEGTIAVVSHGAAIRTWASWSSSNLDADFSRAHPLENTGVVTLEGSAAEGWITTHWQGTPLGGLALEDVSAPDPTGEALG